MSKEKLFLLDGMALAYRAHFAFIRSQLRNSEGIPTGPILGFANTLVKLLEEEKPTHISVVWDTSAPTFRHELDESYKANRPPQPEDLTVGIPLIKEMVDAFGIRNLEQDGYEADDIIGTLAHQAKEEDVEVFLVTPDKDFMQLVQGHVTIIKPDNRNGGFVRIDPEGVKEYFGVYPDKVTDVLACIGDASDNIPGVPGIGKKGAPKLIEKYGSLEKAIEAAPEMKSKTYREGLTHFKEQALHAKRMVTIKTDVPGVVEWESLEWNGPDRARLVEFFRRMEFRTLTRKYLETQGEGGQTDLFGTGAAATGAGAGAAAGAGAGISSPSGPEPGRFNGEEVEYSAAASEEEIRRVVEQLLPEERICFDTETDSEDPIGAMLVGVSLSARVGQAWYIPVNVEGALPEEKVIPLIRPLFEKEESLKIAHNYKYDTLLLRQAGIRIRGEVFCTMVAAYLIDAAQRLNMESLSRKYLQYEPIPIQQLIGSGRSQKKMSEIPWKQVVPYACEDADITLRLWKVLEQKLEEDELDRIAREVDFPLMEVLAGMELAGVKIDREMLERFSVELERDMNRLEQEIFEKTGEEFNLNSPQQLGEVLFEKMGIPAGKKTRTGQYSTAESVLTDLAHHHEVPGLVLDYRSLSKLKSTYVDALPRLIREETGRVHTSFNQTVAATGRLSSSNPNLQNIPIRTERGREIRKAFIPEEGYRILAADYSQIELRVIASISGDENMIRAFLNDEDIHARAAREIFGLRDLSEVTSDHRRKAKEVNFGIPYGVSSYGLASRLGITPAEGGEMIRQYFERFPGVQEYIEKSKEFAREHGYVKTLLGRRRYIPDIRSRNWNVRSFAERTAINMPIQGTAADIIKIAMIRIERFLRERAMRTRMLLQVHDELIFEIHEEETESLVPEIRRLMQEAFPLEVPLKVDLGVAENWLDAH